MRRYIKLFLIIFATLILIPTQLIWLVVPGLRRKLWILPRLWHRAVLRILKFRVIVKGKRQLVKGKPVLYVANHCSYLDIIILGSIVSGSFISKSEVADWPLFGFLAKIQATLFIKRQAKYALKQKKEMTDMVSDGNSFILFPEGTTTDGLSIIPFKSSLFQTASDLNIDVQPIAVIYQTIDGKPFDNDNKNKIAWYIDKETGEDIDLAPHLWSVLGLKKARVIVEFLPVIRTEHHKSRKELALAAHAAIQNKIAEIRK